MNNPRKLQKESNKSEGLDRRWRIAEVSRSGDKVEFQSRKEIPEVKQWDKVYWREWLESNRKGCNHECDGLLELWERRQGIQMGGAKEGKVPEWRWMEFQSSRVNWNRGNESGVEREWLTCIDQPVGCRQVIGHSCGRMAGAKTAKREVGSNQEQMNKGETLSNCGLEDWIVRDLEPESGRDSEQGSSGLEAELEDSLRGVVGRAEVGTGNEVLNGAVGRQVGMDITGGQEIPASMNVHSIAISVQLAHLGRIWVGKMSKPKLEKGKGRKQISFRTWVLSTPSRVSETWGS
ncbi:hypothetical protein DFH08DRAFT_797410 [Mycena albidolilacea]|uniref:Uncharacterized protein n=1 Tax=Mycena albidolilacea TaxID=1033008 RepID=A0AAD7AQX5_9AGAR|nr:hypothetical protein DFH08DRAFT_797410 [Mycena albidolilacea]